MLLRGNAYLIPAVGQRLKIVMDCDDKVVKKGRLSNS